MQVLELYEINVIVKLFLSYVIVFLALLQALSNNGIFEVLAIFDKFYSKCSIQL